MHIKENPRFYLEWVRSCSTIPGYMVLRIKFLFSGEKEKNDKMGDKKTAWHLNWVLGSSDIICSIGFLPEIPSLIQLVADIML